MSSSETISHAAKGISCSHCGEDCNEQIISVGQQIFCCQGCQLVHELLHQNNLGNYYTYEKNPGLTVQRRHKNHFAYLDQESVQQQLLDFSDGSIAKITLTIPQIHCSSCIWLLENLFKLRPEISQTRVNFLKKELSLTYHSEEISLREVIELLATLGYEPRLLLDSQGRDQTISVKQAKPYAKLGIAGFCYGNIMFLSFPEYFSFGKSVTPDLLRLFEVLNLLFSLPLFFYCSSEYFKGAIQGFKQKIININVPIALGIITLFVRSTVDVFAQTGSGYFDSLAGLIFLLLIGKFFQQKTFDSLSFSRDYQSYFPLSITKIQEAGETTVPVKELKKDDRVVIRNQELIPTDSSLLSEQCEIDYSFVTGESTPVLKKRGELIYAGGRLIGASIKLKVLKEVSQSYLTNLWNNEIFHKQQHASLTTLSNQISKYFTPIVILLAIGAGVYWLQEDWHIAANVFSSILIIACPCALALSTPFTLGSTLRVFGRNQLYLKDAAVIEELAAIDTIVFDKTGTLTHSGSSKIKFYGEHSQYEQSLVKSLTKHSTHPLSQSIFHSIQAEQQLTQNYQEITGRGIRGEIDGHEVILGSLSWLKSQEIHDQQGESKVTKNFDTTQVYLAIDGNLRGYFGLKNIYRKGMVQVLQQLKKGFQLFLLSGDNNREESQLLPLFQKANSLFFNQSPEDKLHFIRELEEKGKKTMMLGDGLNDAGALKSSSVGIAVTEDISAFSPACDGILGSDGFNKLNRFIQLAKISRHIIILSFIISLLYNLVGISFAVQGLLSPLVSAILMPLSSITVALFATGGIYIAAKRLEL
ncbi:MAG: heavy metal translocating P-type ATPase [SAR324 cluster bacterium]|uniref:Heavy metal translocating P-type ATPase n=1 Tax=SAR324 cluster bacterium TaxID=2024889 RepID=A0A2A4TCL3_9DELT|nr:MAG: heavy metal translocating P-type ATPase [SAR324 cluster bacterium]